jgi:hypothetical protein
VRDSEGVWRCIKRGTLRLPNGHRIDVAPGTVLTLGSVFQGFEVARMLEDHYRLDPAAQ